VPKEKPKTQREMIDQLWYAHYGTNGDGMGSRLGKVEASQADLTKALVNFMENRANTCPLRGNKGLALSRNQFRLAVAGLALSTIISLGAVLISAGVIPV
jgi:hypothetical protein